MANMIKTTSLQWFAVTFLLVMVASGSIHYQFKHTLQHFIEQQLSPTLSESFELYLQDDDFKALVVKKFNQHLADHQPAGMFSVIDDYSITLERIFAHEKHQQWLNITWQYGGEPQIAHLSYQYQINWAVLLPVAGIISLLVIFLLQHVPKPLTDTERYWLRFFQQFPLPPQLCKKFTHQMLTLPLAQQNMLEQLLANRQLAEQLALADFVSWFVGEKREPLSAAQQQKFANYLLQDQQSYQQSFQQAKAKEQLAFNIEHYSVVANGQEIQLAKTPFFYFLWYACFKALNKQEGWVSNPAVNRPDHHMAQSLLALMKTFQGHRKSISELEKHGLRAKTLDQNRNKIKDELIHALGESISQAFLFEDKRDMKTGRFYYRLMLAVEQIHIDKQILDVFVCAHR